MDARYLLGLGLALATAASLGACGGGDDSMLLGGGAGESRRVPNKSGEEAEETPGAPAQPGEPTGNAPTNSPAGKQFYTANVHPFLAQKCASCHAPGGAGSPAWIDKADAAKAYEMIYANGYAVPNSRVVVKGVHAGGAGPELSSAEKAKFDEWIAMEMKDGGQKSQVNVLEKIGDCFDQQKFQDIGLQNLRTTRRNGENANNCTGCNNTMCMTCHSGDDATNFVLALGNPNLPQTYTFEESKKTNPAYIQKYFTTSPTGEPVASNGLRKKSEATIADKPYTHPMYRVSDTMQARIDEFVNDAITKFKAKQCGQ